MNYADAIERIYNSIDDNNVNKAVMQCLRIARHRKDYFYITLFLHEMSSSNEESIRVFNDDTRELSEEARKLIWESATKQYLKDRTIRDDLSTKGSSRQKQNVLIFSIAEIDNQIQSLEKAIDDLKIPSGMGEYDTAYFTDKYNNRKIEFRLSIRANKEIKERIKSRCFNYAVRVEKQIEAQQKTQSFLEEIQTTVNNYFAARSEDVFNKLQSAAQLVNSNSKEDHSLLLTQVRRAIKAAADYFYSPLSKPIICSDGIQRVLSDDKYLNRLWEFVRINFPKSTAGELLYAEMECFLALCERLNDVASKGVHANVDASEAKQGLISLYLFLYNLCSRLEKGTLSRK